MTSVVSRDTTATPRPSVASTTVPVTSPISRSDSLSSVRGMCTTRAENGAGHSKEYGRVVSYTSRSPGAAVTVRPSWTSVVVPDFGTEKPMNPSGVREEGSVVRVTRWASALMSHTRR
ncbi:hypothetical protein STENM327S_04580 [Streptomyces tendae]